MSTPSFTARFGRWRQTLLIVGCTCAFVSTPFLLYDIFTGYTFTRSRFLTRVDTPWDVVVPMALSFLLADLLVELRRMAFPVKRDWSDSEHFGFVSAVCFVTALCLIVFYEVAVHRMIGPLPVGGD